VVHTTHKGEKDDALAEERLLREMKLHDVHARTGIATSKLSMIERGLEAARLMKDSGLPVLSASR